jgi:hypothetical protein
MKALMAGRFTITLLAAILLLCAACAWSRVQPESRVELLAAQSAEVFLLPSEFRGPVIAVYGQDSANVRPGSSHPLVFSVPRAGLVLTEAPEPERGTPVVIAFQQTPSSHLRTFAGCDLMRETLTKADKTLAVCWLDVLGGSKVADHLAFLVTDWSHIPTDYNRGMFLVDSVLFHGALKGGPKWSEPKLRPAPSRRATASVE